MKKGVFILLFLLTLVFKGYAQDNSRTDKYRTIQSGIFSEDGFIEWGDTDFLVTITTIDYVITKVHVYAKKENQYDMVAFKGSYTDSNNISWGVFECLDNNDERYKLEHGVINNKITGHIYTLKFTNKDGNGLIYKLKRN